jgi:formylglycine-generating enzyme required for sulfatase activity
MDMAGNVWEWCLNGWEKPDFVLDKDRGLLQNWRKVKSDDLRALRGGSYYSDAKALLGAGRLWNVPGNRYGNNGFRVCVAVAS